MGRVICSAVSSYAVSDTVVYKVYNSLKKQRWNSDYSESIGENFFRKLWTDLINRDIGDPHWHHLYPTTFLNDPEGKNQSAHYLFVCWNWLWCIWWLETVVKCQQANVSVTHWVSFISQRESVTSIMLVTNCGFISQILIILYTTMTYKSLICPPIS